MSRKLFDDVSFWGHVQATQVLSIRNTGQDRHAIRARRCRADRKARPQRPLPLRFAEAVSRTAAWNPASMTASTGIITFRDRDWRPRPGSAGPPVDRLL